MKILQIAPAWIDTPPKEYGGTEWVIYNLLKGLNNLGHNATLFATRKSHAPGKLKSVFEKSFLDLDIPWEAALPSLLHYHQAFKLAPDYDFVHAHLSSQTDILILPFLSDLADQNIPSVATIHGHRPYDRYSNMDSHYLRFYGRKVNVINISRAMEKVSPRPLNRVGFIHNSLDPSKIKYNSKGGSYLTWLGKIIPDKGTHEAISIAKSLGEQLVFAGVVDKFQPKSVEYFDKKIKPLIDGSQIIYLGPADLKLKNQMLGGAKGFLNPINWLEPFGMVMLESMAAGTPVISYSLGAAPELIVHGKTGFLVTSRKQMVNSVAKLKLLKRRDCREHVVQHFTPDIAARKHIAVYQKIISATRPGVRPSQAAPKLRQTKYTPSLAPLRANTH